MISKSDVVKIARLAKLSLNDEEQERFSRELSDILGFVEKLNELDINKVEATSHAVEVTNVFREDEAVVSEARDKALEGAPAKDGSLFQVPRVI